MNITRVALPEAFAARMGALPGMPEAARQALELARAPGVQIEDLGRVIETDGALAASVLRFANSAWFGFREPVSNIPHAIVLVGLGRLRSVLLTSAVQSMGERVPERASDHSFAAWKHAIRTAAASRRLARTMGQPWYEEAFVGGLLHDCGRDVFLMLETDRYLELYDTSRGITPPKTDVEQRCFGFTHADVGSALLRGWKLPHELVNATLYHHEPMLCDARDRTLANVISLADDLSQAVPRRPDPAPPLLAALGLPSASRMTALCDEVLAHLATDAAQILDACSP